MTEIIRYNIKLLILYININLNEKKYFWTGLKKGGGLHTKITIIIFFILNITNINFWW